ncbi:hypothetical protein [Streptomyces sp. NPDC088725]|uniref:hypothetical protein n=1 Tax=Streptomyces sp. NPDC088725 TaxID=3365873 RepID=UPI0037FCE420
MISKRIVAISGGDAGISAALRARELDPGSVVSVVVADHDREAARAERPALVRARDLAASSLTEWRAAAQPAPRPESDALSRRSEYQLDTILGAPACRQLTAHGRTVRRSAPSVLNAAPVREGIRPAPVR